MIIKLCVLIFFSDGIDEWKLDCYLRKKQESTNIELLLIPAYFSNFRAYEFPRMSLSRNVAQTIYGTLKPP